jgi:hypothetical protein
MRYLVETFDAHKKCGEYTVEANNVAIARQLARNMHINEFYGSKKWYELPEISTEIFELNKVEKGSGQ